MASSNLLPNVRPAELLREAIYRHIRYTLVWRNPRELRPIEMLTPVSLAIRDRIVDRMIETEERVRQKDAKRLYYLSMEFLMGRALSDNLNNLQMWDLCRDVLEGIGISLDDVLACELDAGLGNGGLGRLAACFLESLATLGMPGYGYGIDYEYGLFRQEIASGFQREKPDRWKANGTPFEIGRPDRALSIPLYGRVETSRDSNGNLRQVWSNQKFVLGVPSDMPVVGWGGETVNFLRLFTARASEDFDIEIFNRGDYIRAVEQKIGMENISRVLYPSDSVMSGKELRLVQEYFLVACAISDLVRRYELDHKTYDEFPAKVAIQMNDTHPSLAVAELMRVFIDEKGLEWEQAWELTQATCAYTNHTLLPEALERWTVSLLERVLPRHMQIIYGINHQFLRGIAEHSFTDPDLMRRTSIIEEGADKQVRMAHLAIVGSHAINGVSELHSELIKTSLVPDFYKLWPERFSNKTNGVAPRPWLRKANPRLATLLTESVGERWITDLSMLLGLEKYTEDPGFLANFRDVKQHNKQRLAKVVIDQTGVVADPGSLFDVQIKRIHEYKRQLLNVMRIIDQYLQLVDHGVQIKVPRTFVFAGKAAPGYWAAKQIIKLIHNVATVVNNDPRVRDRIKVAFLPDYRVSLAEVIIPAADISEQISTAGMEASGTGNMKLSMNGALTVGTYDGANIEILEAVGEENFYLFGLRSEQIEELKRSNAYRSQDHYNANPRIKAVMDCFANDRFSPQEPGLFRWIYDEILSRGDRYFHLADLPSYIEINQSVDADYLNQELWSRKAAINVARIGKFSSDRTVLEYARDIWHIGPFERPYTPKLRNGDMVAAVAPESNSVKG
ncbi:MAG TPA: glycogen/starch/alpha-glucan phosphorylase [Candidatus Koribacter sp.]|jgi:starch phosphorylase